MQWHYGAIDFDSVTGEGTTFRLRLPAAEAKPEDSTATRQIANVVASRST
jgi:light-regulated signal transduction histidine kinase (bacteriophytochrome)